MKGSIRSVETEAHISHEGGRVELFESDWLNVTDHYTRFDMDWQIYTLTCDYALRIEGSGPKVNGVYWAGFRGYWL